MYKISLRYKGFVIQHKQEELPTKEYLEKAFEFLKEHWKKEQEKTAPILDEK